MNPRGRDLKEALRASMERYGFKKYEEPSQDQKGHRFTGGTFVPPGGVPIEIRLAIYDDGIVVDNRSSTEAGDLFLYDALGWLAAEFQLPGPSEVPINRIYTSELFLQFERRPAGLDARLRGFAKLLEATLGTPRAHGFDLAQLTFRSDPELSGQPAIFKFERESGAPLRENRFYSFAHCQTEAHLRLLQALEKALTAR